MTQRTNVCPRVPVTKDKFQRLLAQSWGRVWPQIGKGVMADKMGLNDVKTIDRAVTASNLPEAHTIINSLLADPTALDEVFREFGFRVIPLRSEAANDLMTAAGVIDAMGELVKSRADGIRDHNETLAVAHLLRPHVPAIEAIIEEADMLRSSRV